MCIHLYSECKIVKYKSNSEINVFSHCLISKFCYLANFINGIKIWLHLKVIQITRKWVIYLFNIIIYTLL